MAFPESFATARLRAERLLPQHADEIHRMHQDPEQMALLGGIRNATETAEYMERNLRHWDEYGFGIWLLRDAETGVVAGRALLRHYLFEDVDEVEVGYSFHPAWWGRGLAPEIASACLRFGREQLGLQTIVAVTTPANLRSQRVLIRVGMALDREFALNGVPHLLFRTVEAPRAP
jgi:RimJ/RimL family protein N-acetyltransferase